MNGRAPPLQDEVILEVESVSKTFHGRTTLLQWFRGTSNHVHALQHVSLTVAKGEILGIIGESGSGKTTLGHLLANIDAPTSGRILFHGVPVQQMDARQAKLFRKKVQVIFQDSMSSLNPRRCIGSSIGDALRLAGVPMDGRAQREAEIAALVGLTADHLRRYPHELSGGQRQRVGIARALAMSPEVIVADEPVSALDVSLQGQIINLLQELRQKLGLTIILIGHDLAVVRTASDRIGVMFGGRLVEYGDADEVIQQTMHPYTRELIASVPKGVPGTLPPTCVPAANEEPVDVDHGCPYAVKCGFAMARCRADVPERTMAGETHWAACHLFDA